MADHDNDATTTNASNESDEENAERRNAERRGIDRRAFWRPTPDRRRESTEEGRRETDRAE